MFSILNQLTRSRRARMRRLVLLLVECFRCILEVQLVRTF
jgi:hypothetical protein